MKRYTNHLILAAMVAALLTVSAVCAGDKPADKPLTASDVYKQPKAAKVDLAGIVINLNTAPADSLVLLPGVGEKLAARIIFARNEGTLTNWDDLAKIKGMGPKLIEKIKPFVKF